MFQSDDEITFDEDFLTDAYDLNSTRTSVTCNKRHSDGHQENVVKKLCTKPNPNKNTLNILSIINSQTKEKPSFLVETSPETVFARPVPPEKPRRVVQRRFPGPAGLLPAQKQLNIDLKKLESFDTTINGETLASDEILCSQYSESVFSLGPWHRAMQALSPSGALSDTFTIAWVKVKATSRQLVGRKIPFLVAVIEHVDCSSKDPMMVLKDLTGEIQATVIEEVWEEYGQILRPGSVVILRQIGVLSTVKRHYLAITHNNIVTIYSESNETTGKHSKSPENSCTSQVGSLTEPIITKVNHMTSDDFIKTSAHFQNTERAREKPRILHNDNPFFTTNVQNAHSSIVLEPQNMHFLTRNSNANAPVAVEQRTTNFFTHNAVRGNRENGGATRDDCQKDKNAFVFEPKLNSECDEPSLDEQDLSFLNIELDSSTVNSSKVSQDAAILSQVLDGLDAESIFDDF